MIADKMRKTVTLYDHIGDHYDTTRAADEDIVARLARHLNVKPKARYLDIGCGTGNYTIALRAYGGRWVGLDPSAQMLGQAQQKATSIGWIQGVAEAPPFYNHQFDGAISVLALHHFTDIPKAFRAIDRLLCPGGRFILFIITPAQTQYYWLHHYFPEMLKADAQKLPTLTHLEAGLKQTGLTLCAVEPFYITPKTRDFFFYSGKYRPEIYLSQTVRDNMSPFRTLISPAELSRGLKRLERDINRGTIDDIIATYEYENEQGDYCFAIIEKADRIS